MKFREIFRFEFAYQVGRVSTWLFFAVLIVFAFLLVRGIYISNARSGVHFLNAPLVIAGVTVFGGVIWLLLAAAVAGEAAARDVETRMDPLTYTAPVSKADYLGGRFLAAFVLNALILLGLPMGILLALLTPGLEPDLLGPFRPHAYLTAYFFIALPNAFVATAIQFSWAALGRRGIASYLASGFLLFTSHFVVTAVASLVGRWDLTKLLDLVGIVGIVSGQLDTWAPIEKNTRLIRLESWLLANRLIWLGVALGTKANIRGTYRLENSSAVPIDSIHLATAAAVETKAVAFDRAAASVVADDDLRYRIYALEKPLQPGDSLQLSFEVHLEPRGFGNSGVDASVVANGTYFKNLTVLPVIGYQPDRELRNAGDRRAHGLAPRPELPALDDVEARGVIRADSERTAFEAVVGTDEDQIAVAPGTLRRSWTESGRRYFHYAADAPIKSEYALYSAAYAVHEARGTMSRSGFSITRGTPRIWSAWSEAYEASSLW